MANVTTNFLPADENWKSGLVPFKASTAIAEGAAIGIEIVSNDVTGEVTLMGVENAAGADFVGVIQEPIASTDADYATTGKLKQVSIAMNQAAKAFFTVVNGTFTKDDVFKTVQISSDSLGLDVDTAGKGARITDFINSSRGKCTFVLPNTETA